MQNQMDPQTLRELESELVNQGYSRGYARRLTNELLDHALELAGKRSDDEAIPKCDKLKIPRQLGTVQTLASAVACHRELDPVVRKYPFICFVLIPAILLNLWICFALFWIYELTDAANQSQKISAVHLTNSISVFVLTIVPALGLWFSSRYRVSRWYVVVLTLGLAFSGLFGTSVATCANSQSAFVHSQWGSHWWKLLLPITTLLAVSLILRNKQRDAVLDRKFALRRQGFDPILLILNGILTVVLFTASWLFISSYLDSLREHPIDNLIRSFNSRESQIQRSLNILADDENPLDPPTRAQIAKLVDQHHTDLNQIFVRVDMTDREAWKKATAAAARTSEQTYQKVAAQLSPAQMAMITRAGLKQEGWQAIFDPDVRSAVDLTAYQFIQFKDVYLQEIQETQRLHAQLQKAPEDRQSDIARQLVRLKRQTDARYEAILSGHQVNSFHAYPRGNSPFAAK